MDSSLPILSLSAAAVVGAAATLPKIKARLELSRAKHRSLSGHSKMSRRVARLLPFYELSIAFEGQKLVAERLAISPVGKGAAEAE